MQGQMSGEKRSMETFTYRVTGKEARINPLNPVSQSSIWVLISEFMQTRQSLRLELLALVAPLATRTQRAPPLGT